MVLRLLLSIGVICGASLPYIIIFSSFKVTFRGKLFDRFTVRTLSFGIFCVLFFIVVVIDCFLFFIVFQFCFEGIILVLIHAVPIPDHCLYFTFGSDCINSLSFYLKLFALFVF